MASLNMCIEGSMLVAILTSSICCSDTAAFQPKNTMWVMDILDEGDGVRGGSCLGYKATEEHSKRNGRYDAK